MALINLSLIGTQVCDKRNSGFVLNMDKLSIIKILSAIFVKSHKVPDQCEFGFLALFI